MSLQAELGRDLHGKRWGPRPLDLDIIFYGGVQHNEDGLQIPHPRWEERPFVQASFTCRQHMVFASCHGGKDIRPACRAA